MHQAVTHVHGCELVRPATHVHFASCHACCRKDKYEPKNPDKIQYAYEEEVVASVEKAEEEKYTEDTTLAEGNFSDLPIGLDEFVDGSGDEIIESEEDDEGHEATPTVKRKSGKKKAPEDFQEEMPIEDIRISPSCMYHTHDHTCCIYTCLHACMPVLWTCATADRCILHEGHCKCPGSAVADPRYTVQVGQASL